MIRKGKEVAENEWLLIEYTVALVTCNVRKIL